MSVAKLITKAIYRYFAMQDIYLPEGERDDVETMIADLIKDIDHREDRTPAPPQS